MPAKYCNPRDEYLTLLAKHFERNVKSFTRKSKNTSTLQSLHKTLCGELTRKYNKCKQDKYKVTSRVVDHEQFAAQYPSKEILFNGPTWANLQYNGSKNESKKFRQHNNSMNDCV